MDGYPWTVNLRTIVRFQFGRRDAIEAVAQSRAALWTGIFLVLLTGVPRNYDQSYFLQSPLSLVGPLIFSFFSGSFLFLILYKGFIRRRLESSEGVSTGAQWRSFMSVFWMTAPVAWLYAIPVEKFFGSYQAAQANLTLLAVVSLWRVLLMARVISVMQQIKFARAAGWVLVAACLETLFVLFMGLIFGGHLGRKIMAGMAGMRNAPEENLILNTLTVVFWGSLGILVMVSLLLEWRRFIGRTQPFPQASKDRFPVLAIVGLVVVWIAIAIPAQVKQYHFVTHARLIAEGKYRESVDYLGHYSRSDFPDSRRFEPNPYEYPVWEHLPKVMSNLKSTDPEWVRQVYLEHMDVIFYHRWLHCDTAAMVEMFRGLEGLTESRNWIERNRTNLSKLKDGPRFGGPDEAKTGKAEQELAEIMLRLGVDMKEPDAKKSEQVESK